MDLYSRRIVGWESAEHMPEGRPLHPRPAAQETADGEAQQPAQAPPAQHAGGGLLQGGPVGHAAQAEGAAEVGQLFEVDGDAPVVGLEEGLQGQAGEQLRLGVRLGAVLVGVAAQGPLARGQGGAGDAQRRFAEVTHTR
jgi:hypothetical protein